MEWDDIKTNTQKERVINEAVKSLTKLVESPELKDLLDEIHLSSTYDSVLNLTKEGLIEKIFFRSYDMLGDIETETWKILVSSTEYPKFIEKYKLTSELIEKIYRELK